VFENDTQISKETIVRHLARNILSGVQYSDNQLRSDDGTPFPTDLDTRLALDKNANFAKKEIAAPSWDNPHLGALQQRGLEHGKAYV
jgi:hypothetical protein